MTKRRESDVLSSVLALLKSRGIFALRMQTGALPNSRGRYVSFGVKGMADVLAFISYTAEDVDGEDTVQYEIVWIECKAEGGKQSPAQREFSALVTAEGHRYVVVHSAAELGSWIKDELGV